MVKENEPVIDNFNLCTENGLANPFPVLENLGEVSLLLQKRKSVEEMKQEYHSMTRSQRHEVFENGISQM